MKPLLKATVACTLLCTSAISFADIRKTNSEAPKTQPTQQVHDEFAHLRNSKDNMTKEQAKKVEAGHPGYYLGTLFVNGVRVAVRNFAARNAHNIHKAGAYATSPAGSMRIAETIRPSDNSNYYHQPISGPGSTIPIVTPRY